MKVIEILEREFRDSYKIVDDKTVKIINSVKFPLRTEAQAFVDIFDRRYQCPEFIKTIDDCFANETIICFMIDIYQDIDKFKNIINNMINAEVDVLLCNYRWSYSYENECFMNENGDDVADCVYYDCTGFLFHPKVLASKLVDKLGEIGDYPEDCEDD